MTSQLCFHLGRRGSYPPGCPQPQKGLSLTPNSPRKKQQKLPAIRCPPSWVLAARASADFLTKVVQTHVTHWPLASTPHPFP